MNYVQTPVGHLHYASWEFAFETSTSCRVTDQLCHTLATSVPRVVGAPDGKGEVENRAAAPGLLHIAT